MWSRTLAPGYLDHPPMVALWIRAGTALAGQGALGVRLLAPFAAAAGSLLLVQAGTDLAGGRRAGLIAAGLLNATLLFGVGAVTMTPDTPLLFFWTATLWALGRLVETGRPKWWIFAGITAGLALDSKYTAFLLAPAVMGWLIATPSVRGWLRRPGPWAAFGLAAALFAPVLAWNAAHGWASFAKQGGRSADWQPARALGYLAELVGGQAGLATPLLAVLFVAGSVAASRHAWRERGPGDTLLALLCAIPACVFLEHAMGDRVQANWPSVIYPSAALAAAGLGGRWRRLFAPAALLGCTVTLAVWVQGALAPLAMPRWADPTLMRTGGWEDFAADVAQVAGAEGADFVVDDNYGHAALLARLLPGTLPVLGLDSRWSLFALPDARARVAGQVGLLVRSARRAEAPETADWAEVTRLRTVERSRAGVVAEAFGLYRVTGRPAADGGTPLVAMPRPGGDRLGAR